MSNIKDLVENPHPVYLKNRSFWDFLLNSYEGGADYTGAAVTVQEKRQGAFNILVNGKSITKYVSANLFKHKKERDDDYQQRIQMSYYYNYCSPIIDIYTDHLFKHPVVENFGNIADIVEKRQENIDRMDSSIDEFRRKVSDLAQMFGHVFVIVDMPPAMGEVSLEQRIVNDQFPYFSLYYPQSIKNWSLDKYGRPYWVLLENKADSNQSFESFDKSNKESVTYTIWTRDGWHIYDSEYEEIDNGLHGLKRVPIACIKNKPSWKVRDFLGISTVADISYIARDVYNLCSELQELIRNQTFAFLAMQGNATDYSDVEIGTNKGLVYPEGANAPQYVSPSAESADVIMKQIDRQVEKMFSLAKLEAGSASFKGQSAVEQSGVSKAWDFNQTNSALAKKAMNLEDGEMKLWSLFAAWEGKEFDGSIQYPREFSVKSLVEDLDEAERLVKISLGKLFTDRVKEGVIKKKFPQLPDKEVTKMVDEMKNTAVEGQSQTIFDRLRNQRLTTAGNQ